VLKGVDVAGGINRGRIYRIVPDGVTLRPPPKLGAASTKELVALLDHRNSWHRETAARLLGERQEQSSAQDLRDLTKSKNPVTRVQARYALIVLNAWTVNDALAAFREPNVEAMIHTLRQASNHVNNPGIAGQLGSVIFTSREIRERREALAICGPELSILPFMMRKDISEYSDPLMRLAFLANIGDRSASLFAALSQYPTEFVGSTHARSLLKALVEQVGSSHDARQIAIVVASIDALPENALRTDLSLSFVMKLSLKDREKLGNGVAARVLTEAITKSTENALDGKITLAKRAAAIRSLKIATWEEAGSVLKAGLDFKQPPAVQSAALETLAAFDVAEVPPIILKVWPSLTPAVRATALETLLARKTGTVAFLDSLESKAIRSADLDPARVQILLKTLDEPLKSRAAKLLGTQALSPRKDVIEKYKPALEKQGDVAKGKIIFKNVCSACHKLDGVGQEVGPDLSTQRVKGAESILVNVLDPNREVLPKYYTYKVTTDAGATITGLITADTATSVTIRRADGTSTTIARANIEDMKSTGLSAMPEGLEQQIDVASFADLLAYLMANR
jgi:putative heme-binding domain-containing protein